MLTVLPEEPSTIWTSPNMSRAKYGRTAPTIIASIRSTIAKRISSHLYSGPTLALVKVRTKRKKAQRGSRLFAPVCCLLVATLDFRLQTLDFRLRSRHGLGRGIGPGAAFVAGADGADAQTHLPSARMES